MTSLSEVQRRFLVAEEAATLSFQSWVADAERGVLAMLQRPDLSQSEAQFFATLQAEVDRITGTIATAGPAWVNTTMANTYVEGALTHSAGMAFGAVDDRAITALSQYSLGLIVRTSGEVRRNVQRQIAQSLLLGEGVEPAARRLLTTGLTPGPWRSLAQRAGVIARTEIMRAYNAGAVAGIRNSGADRVEWIATDDERTCAICSPRDGQNYPAGTVDIPAHPRCRCTLTAWYPATGAVTSVEPPAEGPTEQAYEPPTRADLLRVRRERISDPRAPAARMAASRGMSVDAYLGAVKRHLLTMFNGIAPTVNAGASAANQIIRDGRFKSQFETGRSTGLLAPEMRTRSERGMFGYADDLPVEQRPIYGGMGDVPMYGSVRFDLKDSARARTTWLGDDSLGPGAVADEFDQVGGRLDMVPSRLTDPDPGSLPWGTGRIADPLDVTEPHMLGGFYTEIQVHGGLSLDDVAHIDWGGEILSPRIAAILDARGITYSGQRVRAVAGAVDEAAVADFMDTLSRLPRSALQEMGTVDLSDRDPSWVEALFRLLESEA